MSRVLGGEEFAEAYNTFHLHYGLTLAEWAKIEQRLFYWFEKLSQTNHVMARAIFYSAKSLKARLDMFQAALAVADPPPPVRAFLEEMLTKIAGYSTFRNIIVHGEPVLDPRDSSPTFGQFLLVQANKLPYAAPSSSVTVDQLKIASANFAALGTIILNTWLYVYQSFDSDSVSPDKSRELIEKLPNEADCTTPSQKQLGRERQRKAALRKGRRKGD